MTDHHNDQTLPRHPAALTPSGRVWEMVKHVGGKALKYAVFAGIVGGALFALMTGPALGPLAAIVGLFSHQGAMLLMKPVLTTALTGAKVFAAMGGVVGAAVGATDAGEAAEEKEMRQIDAYERQEVRLQRIEALARRRELQRRALSERPQSPNGLPALPREEKRSL